MNAVHSEPPVVREMIAWHLAASDPPDDECTVLVYAPDADEPVWLAWLSEGKWFDVSGAALRYRVHAWAVLPAGGVP